MIKKLHLKNFGHFQNKAFDFKSATLFFGYNESGKTTIFDALLDVICKPKGTTKYGKLLNDRYTDTREVLPEVDGEIPAMNEADFINLFAIRSGTIEIPADSNSQWMNKVKASLFSGGIDPQSAADELAEKIKSNAKGSLKKEAAILNGELEKHTKEKADAEKLKQKCIEEEKRIENMENTMTQNTEEISGLKKLKEKLEKSKEQQSMIQKEKNITALFTDITQIRILKTELENYSHFSDTVLNELKDKEAELQKLKIEEERISVLEEESLRSLKNSSDEKARCEKENIREESVKNLAEHLRGTLVPREKLIRTTTQSTVRKPLIAAAGILIIAGVLAFLFAPNGLVFFAGSFLAAIICAIFSITRQTREDTSLLEETLKQAGDRWRNETGEDPGPRYEDVLAALSRASERSRSAREKYEQIVTRFNALEQEKQERTLQKQKANNVTEEAQRNLRRLLDETGSANISEYSSKLAKKKNLTERYNELNNKLSSALTDYKAASILDLEGILTSRISDLREKITETELPANELKVIENRLREVSAQLDSLHLKDKESIGSVNLDRGTVRGQFKGLNEKIADCEKNIQEINSRLAEIKNELRAAEIARDLFASLSDDSTLMFEQLSKEITGQFSALTTNGRTINLNSFNVTAADISDAQGSNRNEGNLSAGTRDAFLLASRLVLARKSRDDAIIVMDEPFLTLDKQRTERALIVLKEFHENTKWQIIIFTKDEETREQTLKVFGKDKIQINNLS